jgi:hypothetical protein
VNLRFAFIGIYFFSTILELRVWVLVGPSMSDGDFECRERSASLHGFFVIRYYRKEYLAINRKVVSIKASAYEKVEWWT